MSWSTRRRRSTRSRPRCRARCRTAPPPAPPSTVRIAVRVRCRYRVAPGPATRSISPTRTTLTNQQRTVTIVRVDDPRVLPLPAGATPNVDDKVVGVDFSGGLASALAQINSALGPTGLQFSNPAGHDAARARRRRGREGQHQFGIRHRDDDVALERRRRVAVLPRRHEALIPARSAAGQPDRRLCRTHQR